MIKQLNNKVFQNPNMAGEMIKNIAFPSLDIHIKIETLCTFGIHS